jgi:hypothetical protein
MAVRLQTNAVTASPTKANATPALCPEMTLSFTLTHTKTIFVMFSGSFNNDTNNRGGVFYCMIDGVSDVQMEREFQQASAGAATVVMTKVLYLCPGPHTIEVWWQNGGAGTLTAIGVRRTLTVWEEELE